MRQEQFIEILQELRENEDQLLDAKGQKYASDNDRLQNFREIAAFLGLDMSMVTLILMLKHIQSIADAVRSNNIDWCWRREDGGEGLKQHFADARNYLPLLAACIEEEQNSNLITRTQEVWPEGVELEDWRKQAKEGAVQE